jgi:hypothetical protein
MARNTASRAGRALLIVSGITFAAGLLLMFATYALLDGRPATLFLSLLLIGVAFVMAVLGLIPTLTGAASRTDRDDD